jgi:hypothetical protein
LPENGVRVAAVPAAIRVPQSSISNFQKVWRESEWVFASRADDLFEREKLCSIMQVTRLA